MKQNHSKLYSILSFLLIAVLILSVVGVIMRYTNGGTTDFALFYVVHDGQSIMTDTTIELNDGETATFAPKYSADDLLTAVGKKPEKKGYNVKIVPNITKETSFTYQAGDNKYRFEKLADTDFSSAFNLKKEEKFFSVKVDKFTLRNLLSTQYENQTITLPEDFYGNKLYFNMIISSYDDKSVVTIGLKTSVMNEIELDGEKYSLPREATLNGWAKSSDCDLVINDGCVVYNGLKYPVFCSDKKVSGKDLLGSREFYSACFAYYDCPFFFSSWFYPKRGSFSCHLYDKWNMFSSGIFRPDQCSYTYPIYFWIENNLVYGYYETGVDDPRIVDDSIMGVAMTFVVQYEGVDVSPDDYIYTEKMEKSYYSVRKISGGFLYK